MAASDDPISDGVVVLSQLFIGSETFAETLTRVIELARDVLSADMAGITMLVKGRPGTGVFTDPEAPEIDRAQYESGGRGPCVDAFRDQIVYRIDDTSNDDRWPEFAAVAALHGIRSTLSLPLSRIGEPLGALNLYFRHHRERDEASELAAEALAAQAAIVVANAHAYHDARELSDNLQQALTSRRTIDYAIGLLMSVGGRSPEDCFELLVRASQRENRKLRDIAGDMVTSAQKRRVD